MAESGWAEASPGVVGQQPRRAWWSPADVLTVIRIPLAVAFLIADSTTWRLIILGLASVSDFADGLVARRF